MKSFNLAILRDLPHRKNFFNRYNYLQLHFPGTQKARTKNFSQPLKPVDIDEFNI